MLTSSLSFKSLPFPSTQFESCGLPISPLISFHFLSPYEFCLNSILCYVFYLLSPSPCHPSILPWYSSLCWLFKISSLPPQLESGNSPIWPMDVPSPFPFACHVLTPSWMILISFVLCLFTSSPTSLSVITFKTIVIPMLLPSYLPWTYPLEPPLFHPCSK